MGGLSRRGAAAGALATVAAMIVAGCSGVGGTVLRTPSDTMEPTLPVGSLITVDTGHAAIRVGQIVVFHPPAGADQSVGPQCGDPSQGFDADGAADRQPCDRPTSGRSGQMFVQRVVGSPGDRLQITDGIVVRNGAREPSPYITPCGGSAECTFTDPITVPAGEFYVLGDNRGNSDDSRYWGPVPRAWIIGVVDSCSHSSRYCTRG